MTKNLSNEETLFRLRLLNERGHKCEVCGAKNHSKIIRSADNSEYITFCSKFEETEWWDYVGIKMARGNHPYFDKFDMDKNPIKVVLRIAHLDHNELHNEPSNLKLMRQLHHNQHTAKKRSEPRKRNAKYKKLQITLDEALKNEQHHLQSDT